MIKTANLTWSDDGRLYNADYDDVYFQPADGIAESKYVFLDHNQLDYRFSNLKKRHFTIAETGFGSGLNFILAAELFLKTAKPDQMLHFISFEKHPIKKEDLAKIYQSWPEYQHICDDILQHYPIPVPGFHDVMLCHRRLRLTLCYGDITDLLPDVVGSIDAWFLDGFAPAKNPDMWSDHLFSQMARLSHSGTSFATFTAAGFIRRGLIDHRFDVTKVKGFGKKREMMIGTYKDVTSPKPAEPLYQPVQAEALVEKKITILGAGIAGCSVAYALSKRGIPCTIIDATSHAGMETSGNPIGVLYPNLTADENPMGQYYRHGFQFTHHILTTLGYDQADFTKSGVLHMADTDKLVTRYQNIADYYQDTPEMVQYVDDATASQIVGIPIDKSCLYYPNGGYLSPQKFCRSLISAFSDKITAKFDQNITKVAKKGNKWQLEIEKSAKNHETDILIVTNNAKNVIFNELLPFNTRKIRGQVSFVPENSFSSDIKTVICQNGYIPPAVNGVHYAGATFDTENITDLSLSDADHTQNLEMLFNIHANLSYQVSDCTGGKVGVRSTTLDKLPYIGAVPNFTALHAYAETCDITNPRSQKNAPMMDYHDGLYMSVGFGSHGMGTAPLAGEIIACQILGETIPFPHSLLKHVMPQRFVLRDYYRHGKTKICK